jgi:hypothetical protein
MEKYYIKLYSKGDLISEGEFENLEIIRLFINCYNDLNKAYILTKYKLVDEKWIVDDIYKYGDLYNLI